MYDTRQVTNGTSNEIRMLQISLNRCEQIIVCEGRFIFSALLELGVRHINLVVQMVVFRVNRQPKINFWIRTEHELVEHHLNCQCYIINENRRTLQMQVIKTLA